MVSAIVNSWKACSKSCFSISPGGSIAKTPKVTTCFKVDSLDSIISACSIDQIRYQAVEFSSSLTGQRGWLSRRLGSLFLPNSEGTRPCHGTDLRYVQDPNWRELVLFHEYFHADTGRGCGASHQTGWTSLAVRCLE